MTPVQALERVVHCLDRAHETGFKTKGFVRALEVVRATPPEELVARSQAGTLTDLGYTVEIRAPHQLDVTVEAL